MKSTASAALVIAALGLAGCGSKSNDAPNPVARCMTCHSFKEAGPKLSAPNLHGMFGKRAASGADFKYSEALKNSGITWTAENLDAYIAAPAKLIPGTRMNFPGELDAAKRRAIVDYMRRDGEQ